MDTIYKKIENAYFTNNNIQIKLGAEGQSVDYDNEIVFLGNRAGPSSEPLDLFHEMGHLVDIQERKIILSDWGFSYGTPYSIHEQKYFINETYNACKRECKVFAIQKKMAEEFGINADISDLVHSLYLLPDFSNVPGKSQKEKLEHLCKYTENIYNNLSLDNIKEIWFKRINNIQNLFKKSKDDYSFVDKSSIINIHEFDYTLNDDNYVKYEKLFIEERENDGTYKYIVYIDLKDGFIHSDTRFDILYDTYDEALLALKKHCKVKEFIELENKIEGIKI